MKKLTIKSLLTTFIFLLIILIFSYFLLYNPLYKTLEETLLQNFIYNSETNKVSFEYIIERGLENAKSVSSRTMIKNKIIEYNNGIVDLEELKKYTQPKYLDGIKALENVVYTERIVEDQIISNYGNKPENINSINYREELSYEIVSENDKIYLIVYSPIKTDTIIGIDIIICDMSISLGKMELGDIKIDVIKEGEITKYQEKLMINPLVSEYKSSNETVYLNVFYEIYDGMFLHISRPKEDFYYKLNNITSLTAISLIIVFILSFIGINFIIIIFAKEKIMSLDKSNEKYKHDAHYDMLTGAYTRLYLDYWLKDNNKDKLDYSMAFIDVDNFKDINDEYGHQKGDEVLKGMVSIIKNEIRDNDFIVRYGGDEFLILFNLVNKEAARKIIKRISRNLKETDLLKIEVFFSYGIGELEYADEFYNILKEIDLEMYEMKD